MGTIANLEEMRRVKFIQAACYTPIVLLGVIGNTYVIVMIIRVFRTSRIRAGVYVFVLCLSMLDSAFLFGSGCLVLSLFYDSWICGGIMCKIYWIAESFNKTYSVYILVLLSIDRYRAISNITDSDTRNARAAVKTIACVSLPILLTNLPFYVFSTYQEYPDFWSLPRASGKNRTYGACMVDIPEIQITSFKGTSSSTNQTTTTDVGFKTVQFYVKVLFILYFVLPCTIIVTSYSLLLLRLRHPHKKKNRRRLSEVDPVTGMRIDVNLAAATNGTDASATVKTNAKTKRRMNRMNTTQAFLRTRRIARSNKVIKSILLVVTFYLFCWTPYWVFQLSMLILGPDRGNHIAVFYIQTAVYSLPYINSGLNPILYGFLNRSLRRAYRESLHRNRTRRLAQGDLTHLSIRRRYTGRWGRGPSVKTSSKEANRILRRHQRLHERALRREERRKRWTSFFRRLPPGLGALVPSRMQLVTSCLPKGAASAAGSKHSSAACQVDFNLLVENDQAISVICTADTRTTTERASVDRGQVRPETTDSGVYDVWGDKWHRDSRTLTSRPAASNFEAGALPVGVDAITAPLPPPPQLPILRSAYSASSLVTTTTSSSKHNGGLNFNKHRGGIQAVSNQTWFLHNFSKETFL